MVGVYVMRFLLLSVGLSILGCSERIQITPRNAQDAVALPLKLNVSDGLIVEESKRAVAKRIAEGLPVSYAGLTETLLEAHYDNWVARHPKARNPSFKSVLNTFRSLAAPFASTELSQMKAEIEKRAGDFAYPQALVYNARALSVLDAPYDKRVQSYSGTLLFLLSLRQALGPEEMAKRNLVVIFESGHLLPGYLAEENGEWVLFGLETSAAGSARVSYGPLAQAKMARALRIVDADLFVWVELYKFEAVNLLESANQALLLTAEKYGIADYSPLEETFRREVNPALLDWTPFSFGSSDKRDQDRERALLTEAARSELPQESPNVTIQHAMAAPAIEPVAPAIEKAVMNPYPFRQVPAAAAPGELVTQCWDYIRQAWVDIPHRKEGDKFFIRFNPCAYSKEDYEPVPPPLFIEKANIRAPYSIYGGDEDWDDGY